ncbi:MAG: hypothetical protein ABIP39_13770 [Polyangiaceae bacterium]
MHGLRMALGVVAVGGLVSGCAHDPPPKTAPAEEAIVMAPAAANAKPLPEIDPNKPLAHEKDVHSNNRSNCYRSGRGFTTCK